jgi:hypothetical protein
MESAKYVVRRPRKGGHSIARVGVGMRAWMKRSSRPCLEAAAMALMHEVHCTPYALLTKCGTSSSRQMRARSSSLSTPRGAKHEVVESTQSTCHTRSCHTRSCHTHSCHTRHTRSCHTRHTRKGGLCMGGLCASVRAQYCMHTCTCTHAHAHATRTCTRACTCACACACTGTSTCEYACVPAPLRPRRSSRARPPRPCAARRPPAGSLPRAARSPPPRSP